MGMGTPALPRGTHRAGPAEEGEEVAADGQQDQHAVEVEALGRCPGPRQGGLGRERGLSADVPCHGRVHLPAARLSPWLCPARRWAGTGTSDAELGRIDAALGLGLWDAGLGMGRE